MINSYKQYWRDLYERERDNTLLIWGWDPFEDWDKSLMEPALAPGDLQIGLSILYAKPDDELGERFIRRALSYVERLLREKKCEQLRGFPFNRAETYELKALCLGILENKIDEGSWHNAAEDYTAFLTDEGDHHPGLWHAFFLCAIRAELIRGNPAAALHLYERIPKRVPWLTAEGPMWRQLAESAARGESTPRQLASEIEAFFEEIRNPSFEPEDEMGVTRARPEVGAILWRYVRHPEKSPDWRAILRAIAK